MGRNGKVDYSELKAFKEKLENSLQGKELDLFIEQCTKEIAARILKGAIDRTPIGNYSNLAIKTGKVGGTLRRGWSIGDCGWHGKTFVVEIINPIQYAEYVEYGHRQTPGRYVPALGKRLVNGWVEGKFMLTLAEKDVKGITPKLLEARLEKKLREVFQ